MKMPALCAAACALILGAGPAAAATYVASRAVDTGFLDLSITTDDTLGVLATGNILDWTLVLTFDLGTVTLEGPGGLNNSQALIFGGQVSATADDLLYDFADPAASFFAIQSPTVGSGGAGWCVSYSNCNGVQTETITPNASFMLVSAPRGDGAFVIGSVRDGAVPEPAAWALMVGGFLLSGSALRQRRRVFAALPPARA